MSPSSLFLFSSLLALSLAWQCPEFGITYNSTASSRPELIICDGHVKKQLNSLLGYGSISISYAELWQAFWETDTVWGVDGCDSLNDIYSLKCWSNETQQCGNYKTEGDCYNREHTWPKSWWGGDKNGAYTDLHHLYPGDGYDNGRRGNYPYGEVDPSSVKFTTTNGGLLGTCDESMGEGAGSICFEPADPWKGILARGYFYLSVRYMNDFDCCDTIATNRSDLKPWHEDMMRDWHHRFPVTEAEKERNQIIYDHYQYNHNPFVVCPWLVDLVCDF